MCVCFFRYHPTALFVCKRFDHEAWLRCHAFGPAGLILAMPPVLLVCLVEFRGLGSWSSAGNGHKCRQFHLCFEVCGVTVDISRDVNSGQSNGFCCGFVGWNVRYRS